MDYFWCDPQISDLSQEDKATLLYFLTNPHSNIVGVYQVVWLIAAAEMGWTKDQLLVVVKRLQIKNLIDFTSEGWVWVKVWWKHNSALGAFSPKLLKPAKKQCGQIPVEWRSEFIKTLEIEGIDRVSIGYEYPIDTLPPNYNSINSSNSTTTDNCELPLIYPPQLKIEEKMAIEKLINNETFLLVKKQELLDELAGTISTNKIKKGIVPCFRSFLSVMKKDDFELSLGVTVLSQRNAAIRHKNEFNEKLEPKLNPISQEKGTQLFSQEFNNRVLKKKK
jgi:hypothetical protein